MASPNETHHHPIKNISLFIQSTASNLSSLVPFNNTPTSSNTTSLPIPHPTSTKIFVPLPNLQSLSINSFSSSSSSSSTESTRSRQAESLSGSGFPSTVRISSLNSNGRGGGGGPAFVGQVFSMCDLSGTGLMAVSTHFDIPFISKRTPEWVKKMFAAVTKSERKGPVFRFFMDLGDAVSYVRRLNIPSGVVGACRLDIAFEHFKEKPHLFQFVPNEKQVKEANKLLKTMPHDGGKKRVDGVPVFSSQNLDIAIATTDGIKWYTPYFFDKNMLDNILEESVDQHFQSLIHNRNLQRRRDVFDDNLAADSPEENLESVWEPPEVQEAMDEIGLPGIPLSVISKYAEIQLLYAVDRMLLGNRWLRKATGIQPKFPYLVDSFEKRTEASLDRAKNSSMLDLHSESRSNSKLLQHLGTSEIKSNDDVQAEQVHKPDFRFPFGDWSINPWSKQQQNLQNTLDKREPMKRELEPSPFLPKITMVGISTREAGQMSKSSLKKTMDNLTKELEKTDQEDGGNTVSGNEFKYEDRDPLFVANVGDSYSGAAKTGSGRWVRPGTN